MHGDREATTVRETLRDSRCGREVPQGSGNGQEEYDHHEQRKGWGAADGGEGYGVTQHARGQDQAPVGLEVVDEGSAPEAGCARAALTDGEYGGGLEGSQTHGRRDFGDQQGEALVEHVGQGRVPPRGCRGRTRDCS